MKNIRVGVVGLGPHFRETLLPSLVVQEGVILTAFCDTNVSSREWVTSRFPTAKIIHDVTDPAFWDLIDCVVCCSWPHVHEQVLVLASENQKHCFCEKPVATSLVAIDQVLQKPRSKNLVIKIGHIFRYMGGSATFIHVTNGENLACLEVTYLGSGPSGRRWGMDSRRAFSLTHLTHALDFIVASTGFIKNIKSVHWSKEYQETVSATFDTDFCSHVSLLATNVATAFNCKATGVFPSGAVAHLDSLRNVILTGQTSKEKRSGKVWKERDQGIISQNDGYFEELRDFFAEIRGEGTCRLPGLGSGRHVLSVIEEMEFG